MKVRALFSAALAAGIAGPAFAQAPAPLPTQPGKVNTNQTLADDVAFRLRSLGNAVGADISIVAQDGIVTLSGTTKDAAQKARLAADAKTVSGVVVVRDEMKPLSTGVVQVQDVAPLAPVAPTPLGPTGLPLAANFGHGHGHAMPANPIVEPIPLGVPGQAAPDLQAPNLPPYAWPTYAPYNNISRVAYPQAYPYNAFPFIGPYYPFPKVPLGWRKVTLEWEDGHWYLGRNSAPQDYWRVKFW